MLYPAELRDQNKDLSACSSNRLVRWPQSADVCRPGGFQTVGPPNRLQDHKRYRRRRQAIALSRHRPQDQNSEGADRPMLTDPKGRATLRASPNRAAAPELVSRPGANVDAKTFRQMSRPVFLRGPDHRAACMPAPAMPAFSVGRRRHGRWRRQCCAQPVGSAT